MERVLIKISGASLKENDNSILSQAKLNDIADQIKKLCTKYSISIVLGGGNIFRGNIASELSMDRNLADNMGMMATIINGLALENVLKNHEINAKVFSAIHCMNICDTFEINRVNQFLEQKNSVAIFAGGTGCPFFSTDTAASLRASQINAKKIMMGKNGVDGVYDDDPKTNPKANFFEKLSFKEILTKKLKVMDLTSLTMCEENNIEIHVFNIDKKNAIVDTMTSKNKHFTIIK